MKSVLRSIKPYWLYLTLTKQKTIEVAKNRPESESWNGIVEMYCSKDMQSFNRIPQKDRVWMSKYAGKVACQFVCDKIITVDCDSVAPFDPVTNEYIQAETCLDRAAFIRYTNFKKAFGWHISDLNIYDKPKELREFVIPCKTSCETCEKPLFYDCWREGGRIKVVTRPPQSWCYVEGLQND